MLNARAIEGALEIENVLGRDGRQQAAAGLRVVSEGHQLQGHTGSDVERCGHEPPIVGGPAGLDAGPRKLERTGERRQRRRVEGKARAGRSSHLEAVSEQTEPSHIRGSDHAFRDEHFRGGAVQPPHLIDGASEVVGSGPALPVARNENAGSEALGQDEDVARARPALAQEPVRMRRADDRQAVLGLGVADRVTAGERPARLADLGRGPRKDRGQHILRQFFGECRDGQGEQDPAAHREDVGQRVRRGDLPERSRIVDERREEIERADDREVVAHPVDGGVVGRIEARDQVARWVGGGLGTEPGERIGQQVGAELGRAAATVGQLGQAQRRRLDYGHGADDTGGWPRATIARERSGPGGSPGLQNQWRGARRGAVGSTPTRSRHGGPMSTDRPRPPSVERLLAVARRRLLGTPDPEALANAAREVVATERAALAAGDGPTGLDDLADAVGARLDTFTDPAVSGLVTVINATGVILHTNLGRAPWPAAAIEAAARAAGSYSMLEFDRHLGRRGPRFRAAEEHLIALTGAEDAIVTINNAAALLLAVGLAGRRGVAVSRGELVEIGGGVRIPEIVRRTGARLIEVGTTNRTRVSDFEAPLAEGRAAIVLRVHPSNFIQSGFVEAPDPVGLADLAHRHGAIVVDDLGSGALLDTAAFGLTHEPTPRERLEAGADLVTFSGDKLVGGPQAGLVVGRATLVDRIRRDPLARAVRPDKVTLAAVAATLGLYRAGRATTEIPVWRMISAGLDALGRRAGAVIEALPDSVRARVSVASMVSAVGGGSLPGQTLDSVGLVVSGRGAAALAARLRAGDPPVIGRVEAGAVHLDLRTVDPADDATPVGRPGPRIWATRLDSGWMIPR